MDQYPGVAGLMPFLGDGELASLIRDFDWSRTALGPIEHWPQSLRTATGLVVASPVPIVMLWGEDGVMIYNDAYSVFAGARHPELLGSNVREGWEEVADFNDHVMKVGLAGGTLSYSNHELTLYRFGRPEQVFMNLDYSPVYDESGQPGGVIAIVVETTLAHRAQARAEALAALSDRLRDLDDIAEIAAAATAMLGRTLGVDRVGYGTIDQEQETVRVDRDWTAPGVERLGDRTPLRRFGSFIDTLRANETVVIGDVRTDPRTEALADRLEARSARAVVNVPVIEQGRLVALLFVNDSAARDWHPDDIALIRAVAERTRTAVERAAAEAELRASAAALAELNTTLEQRVEERTGQLLKAEEALRQSQKMEAVGQLTGGLAHDFNNLLTGIGGSLEMIQIRLAQGRLDAIERYATAANGALKRAAALTHRLLAFSRRQTLDPRPTSINRLATGMDELIRRTMGPAITVEMIGASGIWSTLVDGHQLENALLNLCINARDAMPDGGRLTIETANKWLDERAARLQDLSPGQYVSLCVTDTGTGMTPDVIAKAFDPFFTTKPLGEGTGLGLSMIYGFARQSGGQVRIYSEVGAGTTMCLYLPRHHAEASADTEENAVTLPEPVGAGQVVLVIDDEPTIRMLVGEVLTEAGYGAIEAADGPSGLRVLESGARIDLLITDVGLPGGLNGRQVADAARVLRPGLKVLFITGYAENAVVGNGHLEPGMALLTKPFQMDKLADKIRGVLNG